MSSKPSVAGVEQDLYAKREKIYPREVHGLFAGLRVAAVCLLLGLYYIVPWIQWDGRQAVLFDLPARKFYIFDLTFWPQDFFYLAALLIIAEKLNRCGYSITCTRRSLCFRPSR